MQLIKGVKTGYTGCDWLNEEGKKAKLNLIRERRQLWSPDKRFLSRNW